MKLWDWRLKLVDADEPLLPVERHLGLILHGHMRVWKPSCYPTIPTLAAESGWAESTVKKATAGLDRAGFVIRRKGVGAGNATLYIAAYKNVRVTAVSVDGKTSGSASKNVRQSSKKRPATGHQVVKDYEDGRRAGGTAAFEIEDHCVRCGSKLRESLLVNGFCPDCSVPSAEAVEAQ